MIHDDTSNGCAMTWSITHVGFYVWPVCVRTRRSMPPLAGTMKNGPAGRSCMPTLPCAYGSRGTLDDICESAVSSHVSG